MVNLIAFNDFWLDCYTTLLYTLLLSIDVVDKAYIYNNQYYYSLIEEVVPMTEKNFISVCAENDNSQIEDKILINKQCISMNSFDSPIEVLKKILSKQKIVMLGVDLYYWIEENIHYNRNHIEHYSLVKMYDEAKDEFVFFETGLDGYQEYKLPSEQVIKAIRSFSDATLIYDINYNVGDIMYTKKDIYTNAKNIISSIEYILNDKDIILCVKDMAECELKYVSDILQTHIFNMENRQKVNRHLFMIGFNSPIIDDFDYCNHFEELENKFRVLKSKCMRNTMRKRYRQNIIEIKIQILELLNEERKIWVQFIEHYKSLRLFGK